MEDLLEEYTDGQVCSLCLRDDHMNGPSTVIPTEHDFALALQAKSPLPKALRFVLPQKFVTGSLLQGLRAIDALS